MKSLLIAGVLAAGAALAPIGANAHYPVSRYVDVAPPPVYYEAIPVARPHHHWVAGFWRHDGYRHVWVPGHFVRHRPGYAYYAPRWVAHGPRWGYVEGYWRRH